MDTFQIQIARDRHAEFIRQAQERRQFDQRANKVAKRLINVPLIALRPLATILRTVIVGILPKRNEKSADQQAHSFDQSPSAG